MSLSLDAYRTKLINKVSTCSTENVQRFINTAVKTLERRNVNGYIVVRFIDKMIIQPFMENKVTLGRLGAIIDFKEHKNMELCFWSIII